MTKFKLSKFPQEAILKIKALFPDGGSLRYSSVGLMDVWITVVDIYKDFHNKGTIVPGDLMRVIPCSPKNWKKPYHNEVVFLVLRNQTEAVDNETDSQEIVIRCCRILENYQNHFKISALDDSDKVFDLYFHIILHL